MLIHANLRQGRRAEWRFHAPILHWLLRQPPSTIENCPRPLGRCSAFDAYREPRGSSPRRFAYAAAVYRYGTDNDTPRSRQSGEAFDSYCILPGSERHRLGASTRLYLKRERRNGRFRLRVIGHPDYGLPFGQDRLLLIWIASVATWQRTAKSAFAPPPPSLKPSACPRTAGITSA